VLANIVPNHYWLSTMLHELGHGVYSKYVPRSLPYALRTDAHPLTTEGMAIMLDHFADNAAWLEAMKIAVPDPRQFDAAARTMRRNRLLIFSRWCQVMFRFEKELYRNPEQDLNQLWWDVVEKYQELRRPEGRNAPDYAAKIHMVAAPAYYHNYMMGEMFAAQVHHAIAREVLGGAEPAKAIYVGNKGVGEFLKERVFGPGRGMTWNDLTRHATGEPLGAKALAADLSSYAQK
jgi:peptidyl-dipeptidase A